MGIFIIDAIINKLAVQSIEEDKTMTLVAVNLPGNISLLNISSSSVFLQLILI